MNPRGSIRERIDVIDLPKLASSCSDRMESEMERAGRLGSPIPAPISEIVTEGESVVTIWIEVPASLADSYKPGQYFMCWNPYDAEGGMGRPNYHSEKPYSVGDIRIDRSSVDESSSADSGAAGKVHLGFTVKDLGRQSGELTRLQAGDLLAIRGPFGTTFPRLATGSTLILVSGGIGSTPMHMAARDARIRHGDKIKIHAIMGFRNEAEAHYIERMEGLCDSLTITTDDGSLGVHGYPTAPLGDLLSSCDSNTTQLYTCGPEPMMKPVLAAAESVGVTSFAAMERYLPCSVAVCGLCMVGDRLTCREGPVMEGDWLLEQDDFGSHHAH